MSHDHGIRAAVRRLRRGLRNRLGRGLARLVGTPAPRPAPLAAPARILVVRLNKRIGNILFTTPLLGSLAATFPRAEIDVLLRGRQNKALLSGLPGVVTVHVLDGGLRGAWRLLRTLRRRDYGLAIDPAVHSASDRVAMLLSGARRRMGFAGADQWLRLSHAASVPRDERHLARQPLRLLTGSTRGVDWRLRATLAVAPDTLARARAERAWTAALGPEDAPPVVAFFVQATGDKQLSQGWWRAWLTAMTAAPAPRLLQLLPPTGGAPLRTGLAQVRLPELDALAALLAQAAVFVAADSGPMHLAAAAGTPTVGLFRATRPQDYAPLGPDCIALAGAALTPQTVAAAVRERLPENRQQGADGYSFSGNGL